MRDSKKKVLEAESIILPLDKLSLPSGHTLEGRSTCVHLTLTRSKLGMSSQSNPPATIYWVNIKGEMVNSKGGAGIYDGSSVKEARKKYNQHLESLKSGNYSFDTGVMLVSKLKDDE